MLNREWAYYFKQSQKKNIFYSDDLNQAKKAFVLGNVIGKADEYILSNTAAEFKTMFYSPIEPNEDAAMDVVNLYNFRMSSAKQMNDLAKSLERFHSKPKPRKVRKVQGGCS